MPLPRHLPACSSLIFPPLAQRLFLCNLLFTSNLGRRDSMPPSWAWMVHGALSLWQAAGCSSEYDLRERNMPNKLLPHSLEAGEICPYMLVLKDYYAEHAKYQLLSIFRAIVKEKISIEEETVGDFSFSPSLPPIVQCLYSVFFISLCLTGILVSEPCFVSFILKSAGRRQSSQHIFRACVFETVNYYFLPSFLGSRWWFVFRFISWVFTVIYYELWSFPFSACPSKC